VLLETIKSLDVGLFLISHLCHLGINEVKGNANLLPNDFLTGKCHKFRRKHGVALLDWFDEKVAPFLRRVDRKVKFDGKALV